MPAVVSDPDWFFHVAAASDYASSVIREAVTRCATALESTASMAGNDEVGVAWGKAYDGAAGDYILQVCRLADAYGAVASRAYLGGVNHLNAEFVASGQQGAPPAPPPQPRSADQRVPFAPPPSSVGDNGPGLNSDIPGLIAAVGVSVPNADPGRLASAGQAHDSLQALIKDKSDDVRAASRTPPSNAGPDAVLLYEEILNNLLAPAGQLQEEGATLATAATSFGSAVVGRRNEIASSIDELGISITITLAVGVLATVVTAGGSDAAAAALTAVRVAAAGRRIYNVIRMLESDTITATRTLSDIRAAGGLAARLTETIEKPLASFEIGEDGTIKITPIFPKWKQDAWDRYVANGGKLSMEEWSKKYDNLMQNISNGSTWDQEVKEIMGYTEENGWSTQQRVPRTGIDRVWDFVNISREELVENKSGRIDYDQLAKDEMALRQGWNVTYNLRVPLSAPQLARLDRLVQLYPDTFRYNFLGR